MWINDSERANQLVTNWLVLISKAVVAESYDYDNEHN